jgi:F-type H+-transporting ATPase subunit b
MPQFDFSTYSSQIFWLIICFSVLYYFATTRILPSIRDIMQERRENTDGNLSKASSLNERISELESEINQLKQKSTAEYKVKIEMVVKEMADLREKKLNELKERISLMNKKSKNEVDEFLKTSEVTYGKAVSDLSNLISNKVFGRN